MSKAEGFAIPYTIMGDDPNSKSGSYMYTSCFAIDLFRLVGAELVEDEKSPLLALHYINEATNDPSKREENLNKLMDKVATEEEGVDLWRLAAATVYYMDSQIENALKLLHDSTNLESMALSVQCLLQLNRLDLAKQLVAKMQEISDDALLTQLAQAWVAISSGTEDMQDAYHIFQEFSEKFPKTSMLINGQGVVHLGLNRLEEAEASLKHVLSIKFPEYSALINMMVLSHLMGKSSEAIGRYFDQIKQHFPHSDFVADYNKKSTEFDKLCLQYTLTNDEAASKA